MKFKQFPSFLFIIFLFLGLRNKIIAQDIPIKTEVLSNGIHIVYISDITKTQNELFLYPKSQELIEQKKGIAELTGNLLLGGIFGKTPSEWSAQLKKEQIFIDFSDQVFSMKFPNSALNEAILFYSNLFQKNAFYSDNLDKAKADIVSKNRYNSDSSTLIAENLGNKIAFGYPHPLSYEIKEAEINNFTVQECKSFLKACYQPQNIVLVVYGNFNQKIVQTELIKRFGTWKNDQDIKLPSIKTSLPPAPNNYFMTPIANGDSTIIAIKYPLDLIFKDENYLPSKLLEIILKNRLNTINGIGNIIDLNITPKRYVGLFEAKFKVSNLVVPSVLKNIEEALNNTYLGRITEEELIVAQNTWIKINLLPDSKTAQIRTIIKETDASFRDIILGNIQVKAITLEQVKLMAYKFLKPKNLNVLIAGDLNFYHKELEKKYKIQIVNKNGTPIKWVPEIEKINTYLQNNVLQNYIEKMGGIEQLKAFKKAKLNYSGEYLGKSIMVNQTFYNEQFSFEWFINGELFQKQVYDGNHFASFSFGTLEELDTIAIKDILALSPLVPEIYFGKNGIKIRDTKIIKTNNIEEIELQLMLPSGKVMKQYFNKETGLKSCMRIPTIGYYGLAEQVFNYGDYQLIDGYFLPKTINIKNENLRCNLTLNNVEVDFLVEPSIFSLKFDKE